MEASRLFLGKFVIDEDAKPGGSASQADIDAIAENYAGALPAEYLEVLLRHDGFYGGLGLENDELSFAYIEFFTAAKVFENNDGYEIPQWEPELLLVGTSGGGLAWIIRGRFKRAALCVCMV